MKCQFTCRRKAEAQKPDRRLSGGKGLPILVFSCRDCKYNPDAVPFFTEGFKRSALATVVGRVQP